MTSHSKLDSVLTTQYGHLGNPHQRQGKRSHLLCMLGTSHVLSFPESRAAAGIHASSPEGNGPGLCTIILAGGRSGGHQAAVMCAVRHLYSWSVLWLPTR
jgi:hypothetical protein